MTTPPIYTEETVDYELNSDGDYVVLKLPDRDYLFDPLTALALGAAFMRASRDLTHAWKEAT